MDARNQPAPCGVDSTVQRSRSGSWRRWLAAAASVAALGGVAGTYAACTIETRSPSLAERARAPEFSLKSHQGATVTLTELVRNGPAVVVFYRGHW